MILEKSVALKLHKFNFVLFATKKSWFGS